VPKFHGTPQLNIPSVLKFFSLFRIFEQLALALNNRVALKFFTVLKYFYHSGFLSNFALALKNRVV